MTGRIWDGKALAEAGKAAVHEDCCCPAGTVECQHCKDNYGPEEWQGVVAGVTEWAEAPTCGSCPSLNGTYIASDESTCLWLYQLPSTICLINYVSIAVSESGGTYYIRGVLSQVWPVQLSQIVFQKSYVSKPDCLNLSGEVLPFLSQNWPNPYGARCDGSGATLTLTAL